MVVAPPIQEIRIGNRRACELRSSRVQRQQPVRLSEGQGIEQNAINNREQRGIRTDTQGQRQNNHTRETRIVCQHPKTIANVLPERQHASLLLKAQSNLGINARRPEDGGTEHLHDRKWHLDICSLRAISTNEAGRSDANQGESMTIQNDSSINNRRVHAKTASPKLVTDDRDG